MTRTESDITHSFMARDRRTLIATLCAALNDALAHNRAWERGSSLLPWQATAEAFESLPSRIMETVLDELNEPGARLQEIEFSGYLETDRGPRAWGFLAIRDGEQPGEGRVEVQDFRVAEHEAGYRCDYRLRRVPGERGAADA